MEPIDQPISNVVDFKTFSYFPLTWRLAATIFIVSGIFLTPLNMFLGIGMVIGGVLVMTTHYRVEIDFSRHKYRDYTWILGIKSGSGGHFDQIEYIYINKSKVSETYNSRAHSMTVTRYNYNGYLRFSAQQKIHLRSDPDKNTVVRHMQLLATKLNCELQDFSDD